MPLTVSQVAKLSHVSVRTLHHYDEIGLLRPSERSDAGYRLYTQEDLERLQQILFFRELEFPLEEISRMINQPDFDLKSALRSQRQLLEEKIVRLRAILATVDQTLGRVERGYAMNKEEMFEVFGDFKPEEYEDEVKERWGDTDAYKESKQKTAKYTKRDWENIKSEGDVIFKGLASLLSAGKAASSKEAMELAEAHRLYITRWFYQCPKTMHKGLGELYINDARFTKNIDKYGAGLSQFICQAFAANAAR